MAQKVYKLILNKLTEAWYQLSQKEQESLMAKVNEALETVGGKRIVACDSYWSSQQWLMFGVEEFPDIEAEQKHAALLNELNLFRYIDDMIVLGTEKPWRVGLLKTGSAT